MSKTHLEIDDALLARVATLLSTDTKRATVHEALTRVAEHEERRAALLAERERGRSGYYAHLLDDDAWSGRPAAS